MRTSTPSTARPTEPGRFCTPTELVTRARYVKFEEEIAQLPPEEQREFLEIEAHALARLKAGRGTHRALGRCAPRHRSVHLIGHPQQCQFA